MNPARTTLRACSSVAATSAISGFALLAGVGTALAQHNQWYPITTIQSPNTGTNLLWLNSSYSKTGVFRGDRAQIWTLNSLDGKSSKGKTYNKGSGWGFAGAQYVSDGSLRSSWIKQGTTTTSGVFHGDHVQAWSLTADGVKTASGPAYFKGTGWHSQGASVLPDETWRALWFKDGSTSTSGVYSGDTVNIWFLDEGGTKTLGGPNLFNGAGWYYTGFLDMPDGTFRVRWATQPASGTVAPEATIWTLDAEGKVIHKGPVLSEGVGWNPRGFGVAPDGTLRLEWELPDEAAGLASISVWALDTDGALTAQGPQYTGNTTWDPVLFAVDADGASHEGWVSVAGGVESATAWAFDVGGNRTSIGVDYSKGGKWVATDLRPGANDALLLVWALPPSTSTDHSADADVWTLDSDGTETIMGPKLAF